MPDLLTPIADYFFVMLPRITAAWSVSDWFTNIFMLALTVVTVGVAFFYATHLRFWDTPAGLSVAGLFFALSALLVVICLGVWFDRVYWGRDAIRPLAFGSAAICVTAVGLTMRKAYREAGRIKADILARKQKEPSCES